jgi:hypothetical protein
MVPVPPLIALALGVLGAAFAVKYFAKERRWDRRRANADFDRAKDAPAADAKTKALPKLRRDPVTGIFRP